MARITRSITALDVAILRFVLRFRLARSYQLVAATGASPWTVKERCWVLRQAGLLQSVSMNLGLRSPDSGRIVATSADTWQCTPAGARAAGEWVVPGTGGEVLGLSALPPKASQVDHAVACADIAAMFRRSLGWEVVSEREITTLESTSALIENKRRSAQRRIWSFVPRDGIGIHPPDLGVVDGNGRLVAVELERAKKSPRDYERIVWAYHDSGRPQVWMVLQRATANRLRDVAESIGVTFTSPARGVLVSTDELVRIAAWKPGPTGLTSPKEWRDVITATPPAGYPAPADPVDLSSAWRKGRVLDVDADDYGLPGEGTVITYTAKRRDEPADPDDSPATPTPAPSDEDAEGWWGTELEPEEALR